MKTMPINTYTFRKASRCKLHDDIFVINHEGRHLWLQKIIFKAAKRFGKRFVESWDEYERIQVNPEQLVQKVMEQEDAMYTLFMQGRIERIIMGPDDLAQLTSQTIHNTSYLEFNCQFSVGHSKGVTLLGVPVQIIPWMKGVVLVPTFRPEN